MGRCPDVLIDGGLKVKAGDRLDLGGVAENGVLELWMVEWVDGLWQVAPAAPQASVDREPAGTARGTDAGTGRAWGECGGPGRSRLSVMGLYSQLFVRPPATLVLLQCKHCNDLHTWHDAKQAQQLRPALMAPTGCCQRCTSSASRNSPDLPHVHGFCRHLAQHGRCCRAQAARDPPKIQVGGVKGGGDGGGA